MDSKKILEKLFKIASNQQKIIEKLAQTSPPPQQFGEIAKPTLREAQVILSSLSPAVKATVAVLEVHGTNVKVRFHPGKGSDAAFQAIQNTVNALASTGKLPSTSYTISEV